MTLKMILEMKTTQETFTSERQWKESVFMVRMGPIQRRFHLVSPDHNATGPYGRVFHSLCGTDSGDWRSIQVGDLPFGTWLCGTCARVGVRRGIIEKQPEKQK